MTVTATDLARTSSRAASQKKKFDWKVRGNSKAVWHVQAEWVNGLATSDK